MLKFNVPNEEVTHNTRNYQDDAYARDLIEKDRRNCKSKGKGKEVKVKGNEVKPKATTKRK